MCLGGLLDPSCGHLGSVLGRLGGILCLTSCQIMAKHRHAIFDVISHDFRLKLPPNTDPKMWKNHKILLEKQNFLAFMLFYDEVASRCDFGVNLASCWHQKTIKIAPWRRLGASWVRLGAFWTCLWASWGGSWAVLGHLGRVLEASWASWGRLGGVLGCLGGCGVQRRDAARARRGRDAGAGGIPGSQAGQYQKTT